MSVDPYRLADHAVGPPPPPLDLDRIRDRAGQRRRRRTLFTTSVAFTLIAATTGAVTQLLPSPTPHVAVTDRPLGTPLQPFDPLGDTGNQAPILTAGQAAHQPTLLPPGYARCQGPQDRRRTVTTTYCGPHGATLVLTRGPHPHLREQGRPITVGTRTAWTHQDTDGHVHLTVSDRDSMNDTHYRLSSTNSLDAATLAHIVASIPALDPTRPD